MNGPTFATQAARQAAPPRPPAGARPGAKANPEAFLPILTWLRLHWLAIAFCGSLLGSAFAYAAYSLLPAEYESYGSLRVASSPFSVSNQKDPNRSRTDFTTYLKTNRELLKYEFVLNAALNKPQSGDPKDANGPRVAALPTLTEQQDAIKFLEEKLVVSSPEGSEVIRVSLRGSQPADLQKIVNAVQTAYMDEVIEKEIKERQTQLDKVEGTLATLIKSLNLKAGVSEGAPAVPPGAPPAVVAPGTGPPDQVKKAMNAALIQAVVGLREQIERIPLAIASQKSRIEGIEKQINDILMQPLAPEFLAAVDADPEVQALAQRATYYRNKYIGDRATYANPDVPSVQSSLTIAEKADTDMKALKEKKLKDLLASRNRARTEPLYLQWDETTRGLREYEERLRGDKLRLAAKEAEMAQLPADPVKEAERREAEKKGPMVNPQVTDLLATDDIYRGMSMYATQLRLDLDSPKRVTILQAASSPAQKDAKKQILGSVAAGLFGFAFCAFVAVGYEARVRKVSSLPETQASTPTPVVGVIPWSPGEPSAQAGEAIDKLRSYVSQTWLARGATTVAVSSALGDEGKAFTAFHLAGSLAAAGYKTLLADFDLRQPSLHTLANTTNDAGVCELLRGEADFRRTIQVLPNGLHLMTAGVWSDEARQAAVGGRLDALLGRLREPFDCVILHAHALLTAAETVEVARRCEVVLLCTLCRETRVPLLRKATDRIATMEIPYSGVVYLGASAAEALC